MSGYRFTPSRRRSILIAQRRSAMRRRKSGFIGKLLARGVKSSVNAASLGASNKLVSTFDPLSQRNVRRDAKLRRAAARKMQKYGK